MKHISITNGVTEYALHNLSTWIPSMVKSGLEGLESPEMREDNYNNPGTHGATVAQVLAGGQLITLRGVIRGAGNTDSETQAHYLSERQAFASALTHQYDEVGRYLPLTLKLTDLNDQQYQLSVNVRRGLKSAREHPTRNDWILQLYNPSGVITSQSTKSTTIYLAQDGGVTYDLVYDIVYGDSSGGSDTLNNDGTAGAKPTITLHGPIQNPRITNATTGEFLALNHTLETGESLVIDAANDTIIQGTSTNRFGKQAPGSVLWQVHPGANLIKLTATTYEEGYAVVSFEDTWGGI